MKGRNSLGETDTDVRIILKLILKGVHNNDMAWIRLEDGRLLGCDAATIQRTAIFILTTRTSDLTWIHLAPNLKY
jgi:hypothetical protein